MRTNSKKVRKILGRIGQHLNTFLKPFALKKHWEASAWVQHSQLFIWFRKSNKDFSYTIFPVKKINVGKILKLWENCYLIILSIHILKLEISGCDITPRGTHEVRVRLHFPTSNNMVEYEALLCGLRIAIETGIKDSTSGETHSS
jgi:hypothetical protein